MTTKKWVERGTIILFIIMITINVINSTITLHNPRGSNNRLNANTISTENQNRLFDSQSDSKSGYCWGPELYYYANSKLLIQWTQSQSCSFDEQCNIVLQYRCDPFIRDGESSDTIPYDISTYNNKITDENDNEEYEYGMHEDFNFYQACETRQRNKGLFTADEELSGETAIYTRQNKNGARFGFECPEERDYFPYWHPSPWKDIAIFVTENAMCNYLQENSQNVMPKNLCSISELNNQKECEVHGGVWNQIPSWGLPPPDCSPFPVPLLINGRNVYSYWWTVPTSFENESCSIRLRLNISSSDYNGWPMGGNFTDSSSNGKNNSPIQSFPTISYYQQNLTLSVNPNWYGRTIEDRSFSFRIVNQPKMNLQTNATIYNLNVQGKRGTLSQTFPSLPYSFVPNKLAISEGDVIHFQWTGCDNNPSSYSGNGIVGTDRSNVVQIPAENSNIPNANPYYNPLFDDEYYQQYFAYLNQTSCLSAEELNQKYSGNFDAIQNDPQNCLVLNGVNSPYFDGGLFQMNRSQTYHFISSRNNNFGINTQKCTIIVTDKNIKDLADIVNNIQNNSTNSDNESYSWESVITISVSTISFTVVFIMVMFIIIKSIFKSREEKTSVLYFEQ